MERDIILDECEASPQNVSLLLNFPRMVRATLDVEDGDRIVFVLDRKALFDDYPVRMYFKKEGTTLESERIVGSAKLWKRGATTVFTIPRGLKMMLDIKKGTSLAYVLDKIIPNEGDPIRVYLKRYVSNLYD